MDACCGISSGLSLWPFTPGMSIPVALLFAAVLAGSGAKDEESEQPLWALLGDVGELRAFISTTWQLRSQLKDAGAASVAPEQVMPAALLQSRPIPSEVRDLFRDSFDSVRSMERVNLVASNVHLRSLHADELFEWLGVHTWEELTPELAIDAFDAKNVSLVIEQARHPRHATPCSTP